MMNADMLKVSVTVEDREDGGLHVYSRDVPGLHLSGADRAHVWGLVAPAVKALLLSNRNVQVKAVFLPEEALERSGNPREIKLHVQREADLLIELAA